jgi:hypothetical protein
MSNHAWVCFDCRAAVRRSGMAKDVRCPRCAQACICLGYKVPIPPKTKVKAWSALRDWFYRYQRQRLLGSHQQRMNQVQQLERQMRELTAMPLKPGRSAMIAYLSRRLSRIRSSPV